MTGNPFKNCSMYYFETFFEIIFKIIELNILKFEIIYHEI